MRGLNLKITIFASVLLASLIICTTCVGNIVYVDADAVGANNGSNWENAYLCLQDALTYVHRIYIKDDLAEAQTSYEIRVANGIYKPDRRTSEGPDGTPLITASGDWTDTFWIWDVTIKGGYAGYGEPDPNSRDINLYETILSGDLFGNDVEVNNPEDMWNAPSRAENSYHVVTSHGNSIIDGFTITGGNANESSNNKDKGGGLYCRNDIMQIINCKFSGNSALFNGGGIYSNQGELSLTNCTFVRNVTGTTGGGGMYNYQCDPILNNCTFVENLARYGKGGGIYNSESDPILYNCTFIENSAGDHGGGMYNRYSSPILTCCAFIGNTAGSGGGINNFSRSGNNSTLRNCLFVGNRASSGGGIYNYSGEPILTNCTLAWNSADEGNALYCRAQYGRNTVRLFNCVLWDGGNEIWNSDLTIMNIFYSNVPAGWFGEGNIDEDPLFADPNGPDNIPGTEDDDLRLAPLSPCIDSGDPNYMSGPNDIDLDGNPRVVSGRVDIGAYEFPGIIYVDNQDPDDPDQDNLQENGTEAHPFDIIQEGINVAKDSQTVLVRPGVYYKIDFMGKAIMVAGTDGAAVIEAWSLGGRTVVQKEDAVTFHTGEGPGSVLKNFIIKNSGMAISLNYGSSPTITNLTIVDNDFGIAAYENSNPGISNCILWNNRDGDLFQCEVRYSCLEGDVPGRGNICVNPLFVDAVGGNYHLKSQGWRWNIDSETWTYDNVTSPCIDAGDPASLLGDEPLSVPRDPNNEYGVNLRINMGAYGGTAQASIPPLGWSEEISAE